MAALPAQSPCVRAMTRILTLRLPRSRGDHSSLPIFGAWVGYTMLDAVARRYILRLASSRPVGDPLRTELMRSLRSASVEVKLPGGLMATMEMDAKADMVHVRVFKGDPSPRSQLYDGAWVPPSPDRLGGLDIHSTMPAKAFTKLQDRCAQFYKSNRK